MKMSGRQFYIDYGKFSRHLSGVWYGLLRHHKLHSRRVKWCLLHKELLPHRLEDTSNPLLTLKELSGIILPLPLITDRGTGAMCGGPVVDFIVEAYMCERVEDLRGMRREAASG